MFRRQHRTLALAFALTLGVALVPTASASHSWGQYHWARTSNPFTLKLGDNVTSAWDTHLATTSADWSQSAVLNTTIVAGRSRSAKVCSATTGQVEVCNAKYGNNGWLGVASIWASGNHITKGTVKLNDTYFGTAAYNTPAWRNLVACQEVGHTLGLDHQDENFNNGNLGTCMDYTNDPTPNQHPNQHDYDQLVTIYGHLDSSSTVSSGASTGKPGRAGRAGEASWGTFVRTTNHGRGAWYRLDLGADNVLLTHVLWAS